MTSVCVYIPGHNVLKLNLIACVMYTGGDERLKYGVGSSVGLEFRLSLFAC